MATRLTPPLRFSLISLFGVITVAALVIRLWMSAGPAGIPCSLAVIGAILMLEKILFLAGVTKTTRIKMSFPSLFVLTSIFVHITLVWMFFPYAAEKMADRCMSYYRNSPDFGSYLYYMDACPHFIALLYIHFLVGYPFTMLFFLVLLCVIGWRRSIPFIFDGYLMLMPLCVGFVCIFLPSVR